MAIGFDEKTADVQNIQYVAYYKELDSIWQRRSALPFRDGLISDLHAALIEQSGEIPLG